MNSVHFLQGIVGCQLQVCFCQADQIVFRIKSPHQSGEAKPSILLEFIKEIAGKSHEPELVFQEGRAVLTLHRNCSGTPLIGFDVHVRIDCILTAGFRVPLGTAENAQNILAAGIFLCSSFSLESQTLFIWAEQLANLSPYHLSAKSKSVSTATAKEI